MAKSYRTIRTILCIGLLSICSTISAQVWSSINHEADEMKGNDKPYTTYFFVDEQNNRFLYRSDQDGQFIIATGTGFFSCQYYDSRKGAIVKVGLYGEDGKLIEMFDMFLRCASDDQTSLATFNWGAMSNPVGQSKKVRKLMSHLNTSKGYVRILAPIYSRPDMDFRILCRASSVEI